MRQLKVLIAHQSSIPHYRIPFYNALKSLKPDWWDFEVVYDFAEQDICHFFKEVIDLNSVKFNIYPTKTYILNKKLVFQDFILKLRNYDLIIVEDVFNNLSYPLAVLYKIFGMKLAYWGHGRDISAINPGIVKKLMEKLKLVFDSKANGYFAYTQSVKNYLKQSGIDEHKIFLLNNTIDIMSNREKYISLNQHRKNLRKENNLDNKKVLLYVGRLNKRKKMPFLVEAFKHLYCNNSNYKIIIVGDGDLSTIKSLVDVSSKEAVIYRGALTDSEELAKQYIMSDIFVFPGDIGLGPLTSLTYNLLPIVVDSNTHNPEYDYLNSANTIILPMESTPLEYANKIEEVLNDTVNYNKYKNNAWESINNLTIDNMADNFINGINIILKN